MYLVLGRSHWSKHKTAFTHCATTLVPLLLLPQLLLLLLLLLVLLLLLLLLPACCPRVLGQKQADLPDHKT